jgi:hypothetical protein
MAASFTLKKHVNAPPPVVFARASDFANAPTFITAIKKVEILTPGPVQAGTRFRETRVMFKREASEVMEVTAFAPPTGYTLTAESCGCRYRTEFRFTPSSGGTDVAMTFEGTPLTFIAKVMGFLMKPMIKMCAKETQKDLDDLARACEAPAGQARHRE